MHKKSTYSARKGNTLHARMWLAREKMEEIKSAWGPYWLKELPFRAAFYNQLNDCQAENIYDETCL